MNSEKPSLLRHASTLRGFTLMEVMAATGVLGVVFVALYSGMTYGVSNIRLSRENLRATQILGEKMDEFRLYSWSQVTDGKFIPKTFSESYAPGSTTNKQGIVYTGTITISALDKQDPDKKIFKNVNYADDLRKITIDLTWQTGNIKRSRTLETYVAHYGLQNYVY